MIDAKDTSMEEKPEGPPDFKTLADIIGWKRPAIGSLKGNVTVVMIGGAIKEIKASVVNPIEFDLDGIPVPGVELVVTPSLLGPNVEKRYRIPFYLIRAYFRSFLIVEADGFKLAVDEIRGRRRVKIYVARPTLLGWLLLLDEAKRVAVIEGKATELALAFKTFEHAAEVARRAVRVTVPGLLRSELQTALLPAPVGEEPDVQEFLETKLKTRKRRG